MEMLYILYKIIPYKVTDKKNRLRVISTGKQLNVKEKGRVHNKIFLIQLGSEWRKILLHFRKVEGH